MKIGDRFKQLYETPCENYLVRHIPVIIRVDGKAFHSLKLKKPFDDHFADVMISAAISVIDQIQGAVCAYQQSDEVSFLLWDWQHHSSDAWFGYNKAKLESVTASLFTAYFNQSFFGEVCAFDARAFSVPKDEVPNYFIWRQRDCVRNSVSMFARSHFSQKQIQNLNNSQIRHKLRNNGTPWGDVSLVFRFGQLVEARGICVISERMGYDEWARHTTDYLVTEVE